MFKKSLFMACALAALLPLSALAAPMPYSQASEYAKLYPDDFHATTRSMKN